MTATPTIFAPDLGGVVKATWDFAEHGGAIGDIELDLKLPENAVVYGGIVDVVTDPTSGGAATIALKIESAADLLAPTLLALATGQLDIIPSGLAATVVKTTVERTLALTVGVSALTAGKLSVFLFYFLSE